MHKVLSIQDVVIDSNCIICTLRFSKVDQAGIDSSIKISRALSGNMCPLQFLNAYLESCPEFSVPGPLIRHLNGDPLSRYQFTAVLKNALFLLDPRRENNQSHSFHIGAASITAKLGWSAEEIKMSGRWSSNA